MEGEQSEILRMYIIVYTILYRCKLYSSLTNSLSTVAEGPVNIPYMVINRRFAAILQDFGLTTYLCKTWEPRWGKATSHGFRENWRTD